MSLASRILNMLSATGPIRARPYPRADNSPRTTHSRSRGPDFYPPVLLGSSGIASAATSPGALRAVLDVFGGLEPDEYTQFLREYMEAGRNAFGAEWKYADIATVLYAAASIIQPRRYLEIGVRRGRSMAVVAAAAPQCTFLGFDMWMTDYAGMSNPGPDFVRTELARLGHTGTVELISGNSHQTVAAYFRKNPDIFFDIVTVDGDHTPRGAREDLLEVMPRIAVGGVLVFDDIAHPDHEYLLGVWRDTVTANTRFSAWEFSELGFGVAFAVRKR